ncbi:MAG: PaaI family thioesterase [Desulfatiglandales bacterium]
MNEERIAIPKLQGHHCFACGTANPIGLNLHFYRVGDSICTDITLGKYHEGWQNVTHGGIISTLLDEVMSWTIMYFKKVFFVTRKMEIKYIKPVLIETPLTATGWLIDDSEPPKIRTRAEIRDDKGSLLVRSSGEFVVLPEEKLSSVPDELKKDMLLLFKRFPEPQNVGSK